MKTFISSCEVLEIRIAPAQFFLSHTTFDVVDKNGTSVNDAAAASAVGADLAVFLAKGDSAVLDTNGNHRLDRGEVVFAKVTGGSAVLFAKAHDMNNAVDADELTGLIVSDKFNGTIKGDLHGTIATGFTAAKTFNPAILLDASIAGLTVTGLVSGDILAGKNLTKISLGTAYSGDAHFDAKSLRAGTAASGQTVSFNGGGTSFTPTLGPGAEGAAGGSISHVKLALGAKVVAAGNGAPHSAGKGGAGGSVTDLKITHFSELGTVGTSSDMQIIGGNGATGAGATGQGGLGGAVRGLSVASSYSGLGGISIQAGAGGDGHLAGAGGAISSARFDYSTASHLAVIGKAGAGGAGNLGTNAIGGVGGSVTSVTVKALSTHGRAEFWAGNGGVGQGTGDGRGGAGGNVSKYTLTSLGGDEAPYLRAGSGASSIGNAPGGAGGAVSSVKVKTGDIIGNSNGGLYIYGGDSGWSNGGPGGAAGSIKNLNITMGSLGHGEIYIYGGDGGRAGGHGGDGGSVSNVVLKAGSLPNSCYIGAGTGGNGNYYSGDPTGKTGGNGGSIQNVKVDLADIAGDTEFGGGDGGAGNGGALGGRGGSVKGLTMNFHGTVPNDIDIVGGRGGAGTNDGPSGAGGDVRGVRLNKLGGTPDDITIHAGKGGDIYLGPNASGGNAGDLFDIKVTAAVPLARLEIGGHADGASAGANGTLGGDGSSLSKITVSAPDAPFVNGVFLNATRGGDALGAAGHGGAAGSISGVVLDVPGSLVRINADPTSTTGKGGAGGSGAGAIGGAGGSVSGISGKVGTLVVQALGGGSSGEIGGDGGDVTKITLTQTDALIREVRAGDGGNGTAPGHGGSISAITTRGDIGDFAAPAFNTDILSNMAMGGLFAGQSPTPSLNGSVTGISAARIAAILAGTPAANALTAANAASSITKIKATAIGADRGAAGFDFTDNDGDMEFELGDGDTALDGLVIVRAGSGVFPVDPLKLMETP